MIDYMSIGQRVKKIRQAQGITQEQLSEAAGVGVTHISHLETGAGTVSLRVFIAIINCLNCSADELLCREIRAARPYMDYWLAELTEDCNESEIKIIADTVLAMKASLRKNMTAE